MIKCRAIATSPFCHSCFVLFSSFVIRASSFPRHDCTERQFGQRIRGTHPRLLFRERPALESKEFRVPSATAGDGNSGRASAGGRTAFDSRSGYWGGQIAGLPGAVRPFRTRAEQKSNRFNAHHQSPGTTAAQRHSDLEKSAASRV